MNLDDAIVLELIGYLLDYAEEQDFRLNGARPFSEDWRVVFERSMRGSRTTRAIPRSS